MLKFIARLDAVFEQAWKSCFEGFSAVKSDIVSMELIDGLTKDFKQTCPLHYEAVRVRLNYHNRPPALFNEKMILMKFLQDCKLVNGQWLPYYMRCFTAAFMPCGTNAFVPFVANGITCCKTTMLRDADTWLSTPRNPLPLTPPAHQADPLIMQKTRATLSSSKMFLAIYDNAQKQSHLAFQQGAQSSTSTKCTMRMFVQLRTNNSETACQATVPLTYVKQPIPSPFGMPAFELLSDPLSCIRDKAPNSPAAVDVTGSRVAGYMSALSHAFMGSQIFDQAARMRMWPEAMPGALHELSILYDRFQRRSVESWKGPEAPTNFLILPVSMADETTTLGSAQIILDLMVCCGMLQKQLDNDGTLLLGPADDIKDCWLLLVGDGLSLQRIMQFKEKISPKHIHSFTKNYYQARHIREALERVVIVPGDLHAGGFHFLQPIFDLYYHALLHPFQVLLGWKRVRYGDVTQCYKIACDLATFVDRQGVRYLFRLFMGQRSLTFDGTAEQADSIVMEFELQLARWRTWHEDCDEAICLLAGFVHLMSLFNLFQLLVRRGDSVSIEALYTRMLPIWYHMKKTNYREIALFLLEQN